MICLLDISLQAAAPRGTSAFSTCATSLWAALISCFGLRPACGCEAGISPRRATDFFWARQEKVSKKKR
jgi:hypothetical protein